MVEWRAMKKWMLFVLIALALVANAVWFYSTLGWDAVDDAYISYVYAQNAILGHGLTFNPSERVEGFSNFLWTAMMLPVVGAGTDVGRVSSALGLAFGIGVLGLTIRFARRLELPSSIGWIAALFLAADGSFALWSVSGLETSLFAFLVTLGAFLYVQENMPQRELVKNTFANSPLSGIIFALAAMTRPEAAAVFAVMAAHQAAWRMLDQRKLFTRSDILRIAGFLVLFVPYWLARWRYYHSFLPNSFYAKVAVGGPISQIERGWEHLQQFVGVHLGWVIVVPLLVTLAVASARYFGRRKGNAVASVSYQHDALAFFGFSYFGALILFYSAYIVYVGGDWSVGRFFVPFLPFAYLMISASLYWTVEFVMRRAMGRGAQVAVLVALILAPALWFASAYNGEYRIFIGGFEAGLATHARIAAGKWLKQNVPAGTWIAVDAAGQVPYFSGLPAIDMFGINDLHIGRMSVANLGSGTPGHEKFDLGYIIARAPKYVVIYGTLFDSVSEYRRANVNWTDKPELEKFLTIYERVN